MPSDSSYDAVVVGSGPNGLAAAIRIAQAGCSVLVLEAKATHGGGTRTMEMTLPGFLHDVCSAIHPLGLGSPFFRALPLEAHGLRWVHPPAAVAHPLDGMPPAVLLRSLEQTAGTIGEDGPAYRRLMGPFASDWTSLMAQILGPFRLPPRPLLLARFGLVAIRSASSLAKTRFRGVAGRALFAGLAAHSMMPLSMPATAAFALVEGVLGHTVGWPLAQGGSQAITDALASLLRSLGGQIVLNREVRSLRDLPQARALLFDVTPRQLLSILGERLPPRYRGQLEKYRYGVGVFKVDWALEGPIPWRDEACGSAATIHVGGSLEEIAASEAAVWRDEHPDRPFVILAQQSLFDPTRAPVGKHTGWAYCHVPHGSQADMTDRIEAQVERFAPGFRERILARHTRSAVEMEAYNPNYVGGDINGGVQDLRQLFTRPTARLVPYSTPLRGVYLCSSSTPPGGGVHGMCGFYAAEAALKRELAT